jgi:tRNA modification GTPase
VTQPDTIAAVATAPGVGGIGVVRISGPGVAQIAVSVIGSLPIPRLASYRRFLDTDGEPIDEGIALFFPSPHSFTGDDVLELQGHGGPVVLDMLLQRVLGLGARAARPGEFSERAFLNGKLDLARAEAIADLIHSATETQARLATRTLRGVFSRRVDALQQALTRLRAFVEAALDFPDEDIDVLSDPGLQADLTRLIQDLDRLHSSARQGELIRDGLVVVIAGAPNAGKSSLLNSLAGHEAAIVTPIPGTTRDLLRADIQLDGLPLRLIDTAGLRDSQDPIEQEGVRRARAQINNADRLLWMVDDVVDPRATTLPAADRRPPVPTTLIRNKIDLSQRAPGLVQRGDGITDIACSMTTGAGLDLLRAHLKAAAGYLGPDSGEFSARRRHLDALARTSGHLVAAAAVFSETCAPELMAEDLRQAQHSLGEITGEFAADDLLGEIFGQFCIGK